MTGYNPTDSKVCTKIACLKYAESIIILSYYGNSRDYQHKYLAKAYYYHFLADACSSRSPLTDVIICHAAKNLDIYQILHKNSYAAKEEFVPVLGRTIKSQVILPTIKSQVTSLTSSSFG